MKELPAEAIRVARGQPLVAALALVTCALAATFLTIARAGAADQREQLARDFDTLGARLIEVLDNSPDGQISRDDLQRLRGLQDIEWAIGLGDSHDVENAQLPASAPVAARPFDGVPPFLQISTSQRQCGSLVSSTAMRLLGIDQIAGATMDVDGVASSICGSFRLAPESPDLGAAILIDDGSWKGPVRRIIIAAKSAAAVSVLGANIRSVLGIADLQEATVQLPESLLQLRAATSETSRRFGSALVLSVLAGGAIMTFALVYFSVASRRKDFGRRRAIGASRGQLCAIVLIQFAFLSSVGVGIGLGASAGLVLRRYGELPPTSFEVSVAGLVVLTTVFASLVPAVVASRRDPLAVLRVP